MKIRDIIVEQEKPGLLRRAAGAIGRHVYSAATGKAYREPKKPAPASTSPAAAAQAAPAPAQAAPAPAQAAPAQPSTKGQQPIQPKGPAVNITQTVPDGVQYRFQHPEYWKDDVNVIIRQSGIYIDKLPKELRGGQVRRDKETGLYKVDRSDNIAKLNNAYNTAADEGRVIEEPAGSL